MAEWLSMIYPLALFLAITVLPVAERCSGEAGWPGGTHLCACTVKARLDAGWTESAVLDAYYAQDAVASPEMLEQVERGLRGEGCPLDSYYLFGAGDVRSLDLDLACASGRSFGNGMWVYTFPYDALQQCGQS